MINEGDDDLSFQTEVVIRLDEVNEVTRGMLAALRTMRTIMVVYAMLSVAGAIVSLVWLIEVSRAFR